MKHLSKDKDSAKVSFGAGLVRDKPNALGGKHEGSAPPATLRLPLIGLIAMFWKALERVAGIELSAPSMAW